MPGAAGKDNVLTVALGAQDEATAILYQQIAELLNDYDERVAQIARIERFNRMVITRDVGNKAIALLPLDYVIWNERAASASADIVKALKVRPGSDRFELWITGTASPRFKTEAAARGIVVKEGIAQQLPLVD